MPSFNPVEYEKRHYESVEQYVDRIEQIYFDTIAEATRLSNTVGKISPDKVFSFSDYPQLNARVKKIFEGMAASMIATIAAGQEKAWDLSSLKNDALVKAILPTTKLSKQQLSGFMDRNLNALKSFQDRKVAGLKLSDRVWKQTEQFKNEIELWLDLGIGEGMSAARIASEIKANLQEPDKLFRRVRDKHGVLKLSKAAKSYNPGQGVYRSSFKNALRLTRTETNIAYRSADYLHYQQLPFVVGIEVRRSNKYFECDVCESLKGRYPATYKFSGNHSNCKCYVVTILATKDEIDALTERMLNDEPLPFKSINEVKEMPQGWIDFMSKNKEKLLTAKSKPFFVTDNPKLFPYLKVG